MCTYIFTRLKKLILEIDLDYLGTCVCQSCALQVLEPLLLDGPSLFALGAEIQNLCNSHCFFHHPMVLKAVFRWLVLHFYFLLYGKSRGGKEKMFLLCPIIPFCASSSPSPLASSPSCPQSFVLGLSWQKWTHKGAPSAVFWSCTGRYYGGVTVSRKLHGMTQQLPLECLLFYGEESSYASILFPVPCSQVAP